MIGVYGGTFDPIHFGHLRPAMEILQAFGLSQIRFIPCGVPPHREAPRATPEQRVAMLECAIEGVPEFVCDTREIRRDGPSYMLDTLRSLQATTADEACALILGMDAFAAFHTWHRWRDILGYCNLLVMQRPEFAAEQVLSEPQLLELVREARVPGVAEFVNEAPGKLLFYPVTQLDISSSRIREWITQGRSLRYLMPERVIALIEEQGIYH
jgi:nicotinate-nucleotide adenylyltransferase